jgi:CheY-like chemotaxis protein
MVCDVEMPGVDGIDLVVRARQLYPDVVRVLLTAGTSLESAIRAVNEGEVFRILKKPISGEALGEVLSQAVARREALRRSAVAEGTSRKRAEALAELEPGHPGIGSVFLPDGIYVISQSRQLRLEQRFAGSALAQLGWEQLDRTMDLAPEDLEEISDDPFGDLRSEYGRSLPSRIAEIREALNRAWQRDEVTELEEVRREAHALAGSAGTYGYQETGETFRLVEQILRDLAELRGTESEPQLWQQLQSAMIAADKTLPAQTAAGSEA